MGGEKWREYEGLDGHELDQDVEGWTGRVLERIADGVADHGRLVGVRPLGTQGLGVIRRTCLCQQDDNN